MTVSTPSRALKLNGLRGVALIVMGLYALTRAVAYLPMAGAGPEQLPRGLAILSEIIPIQAWGGVWLILGVTFILRAFTRNDSFAWGCATGIMVIWGLGYAFGWIDSLIVGNPNRDWIRAMSYIGPAVVIGLLSVSSMSAEAKLKNEA